MRLCTTHLAAPRTWTVELRPQQPRGTLLVCAQCSEPKTLQGGAVRSEALAHLARHARYSLLPEHLRTCQCHECGCRWHPRHRGCSGPLLLVLSRELGGRLWRLADVCAACTAAMKDASVVPTTALTGNRIPLPTAGRRRPPAPTSGQERGLVRDMLSYLASSLSSPVGAEGRLLALQCALRSGRLGDVSIPAGLTRGMGREYAASAWPQLEAAAWLRRVPCEGTAVVAQLTDPLTGMPGLRARARAADWALRTARGHRLAGLPAGTRLAAVALQAHTHPDSLSDTADAHQLARACVCSVHELLQELRRLVAHQVLSGWTLDGLSDDLTWQFSTGASHPAAVVPDPRRTA